MTERGRITVESTRPDSPDGPPRHIAAMVAAVCEFYGAEPGMVVYALKLAATKNKHWLSTQEPVSGDSQSGKS